MTSHCLLLHTHWRLLQCVLQGLTTLGSLVAVKTRNEGIGAESIFFEKENHISSSTLHYSCTFLPADFYDSAIMKWSVLCSVLIGTVILLPECTSTSLLPASNAVRKASSSSHAVSAELQPFNTAPSSASTHSANANTDETMEQLKHEEYHLNKARGHKVRKFVVPACVAAGVCLTSGAGLIHAQWAAQQGRNVCTAGLYSAIGGVATAGMVAGGVAYRIHHCKQRENEGWAAEVRQERESSV